MNSSFSPSTSAPDINQARGDFARDGFAIVRGAFDAREALVWRDECERLLQLDIIDPDNLRTPFEKEYGKTVGEIPKAIEPVTDISPLFSSLAADERVLGLVRACLDDEPLLFKDKLIWKMPGAGGFKLHQDQADWPISEPENLIAVSIHIDAADEKNGCLEVVPNAHHALISELSDSDKSRNLNASETEKLDSSRLQKIEAQPGDLVILHALAPHQSADNNSGTPRRSLYFTYNAARAGALYAAYETHYQESLTEVSIDARDDAFFR